MILLYTSTSQIRNFLDFLPNAHQSNQNKDNTTLLNVNDTEQTSLSATFSVFGVKYSQSGKMAEYLCSLARKAVLTPMMSSGWSQPVLQILNTKLALRATSGKFKIALFSLDKKISNTQQVPAFVFHVNGYNWHLLPCQIALQRSQLFIGHSSNWLWGKHPRGHANFLMRVEVKEVGLRLFF